MTINSESKHLWNDYDTCIYCGADIQESDEDCNPTYSVQQTAPELLNSLQWLIGAADTEPGMAIYKAHLDIARAAIAKAKGR